MKQHRRLLDLSAAVFATLAATLAGCGGGGTTSNPTPTPSPSGSPSPTPTPSPAPNQNANRLLVSYDTVVRDPVTSNPRLLGPDIYAMDPTSGERFAINDPGAVDGFDEDPAWSPDHSKIAFVSSRNGNREIYVIGADGANLRRLTNNVANDTRPAWSPDGAKIAFSTNRDGLGSAYEIYVMNADGTGATRLTNNGDIDDSAPTWSPDGTRIAFSSARSVRPGVDFNNVEIYVMNADGSNPTRVTNNPVFDGLPAFSPDGARLAYSSHPDGVNQFEIRSIKIDGTDDRLLTRTGPNNVSNNLFAWSPDGSQIAFIALGGDRVEVFTMNAADGSGRRQISRVAAEPIAVPYRNIAWR